METPPNPDEIEISLFGPGIGECLVIHLGNNDWAVVDSCVNRNTGNPIALDYLERLGVPADRVRIIVASHWHNDHTRGIAKIFERSEHAEFVCSGALRSDDFKQLIAASIIDPGIDTGINEFAQALNLLRKRKVGRLESRGPKWATANKVLFQSDIAKVYSLSPSDGTLTLTFSEIASLLPALNRPKLRAVAHTANEVSVVLWIEMGLLKILLGSDLEINQNPNTGWQAIINSGEKPQGRAFAFKIAHHGSETGDHSRVWQELLDPNPQVLIAPFLGGGKPIPTKADCQRILTRTSNAFVTCAVHARKPKDLPLTAGKLLKRMAPGVRDVEGVVGHIRLRAKSDGSSPVTVELSSGASRLSA